MISGQDMEFWKRQLEYVMKANGYTTLDLVLEF